MRLQHLEINGFKSFAKKATLSFSAPVSAVVGPNGSGKSNVVEAFRFVLGEQSMKSMRGKSGADLIFRGGTSSAKLSRASVSVTFDNSDKVFAFMASGATGQETMSAPLLFEQITFTRELFADGTSKYLLNGTEIKLKQMVELLSSVNIGTSSHHIISQGEADGILRANTRERREMLEDALGLKIYHLRIKETESKLVKTIETLKDVQSLRRELAPHLHFLKKQVEKIEKGKQLREELKGYLLQFLAGEQAHLLKEEGGLKDAKRVIGEKKIALEAALAGLPTITAETQQEHFRVQIESERRTLLELAELRRTCEQKIGRFEGRIEAHRALVGAQYKAPVGEAVLFAPSEYDQLLSDIAFFIAEIEKAQTIEAVKKSVTQLSLLLAQLQKRKPLVAPTVDTPPLPDVSDIVKEVEALQQELSRLIEKEEAVAHRIQTLEKEREVFQSTVQGSTETRYTLRADIQSCDAELQILAVTFQAFVERKERFDQELKEAAFLFGPSFLHDLHAAAKEPLTLQTPELRRTIDRLKIRLEEHSGIGNEVLTEYESTKERDEFLTREVLDIESSIKNLETLVGELKKVLDERFTSGVKVINERFGEFFKTMFGGGNAFLSITMEKKRKKKDTPLSEEELLEEDVHPAEGGDAQGFERGIDVHVSLPEKKVKELTMLSGGERSLVSIALLFAISQVNPPPFLVLDETDAALDEANSRRYGDMVERLSEYSQLIVVTHNRETMSRAGALFGVTLGSDGGSKLLSIKFDEAVKVAK